MRDTSRCLLWFCEAPRPDGVQDFCPAVFPPSAILEGGVDGFDPLEKRVYRAFVDHLREALEGYGWQTGENLAQALSPRTDGPALARRAPRRSGPGRRREAEPDQASDNRVARAVESCCGSAGPARRSGAAPSESPHLGSRSGEQPREYSAGRVGSSARQRRNAPVRADGRTAARLARRDKGLVCIGEPFAAGRCKG